MKEFVKKHEEILKTIGVILGIIVALTTLFFVSENTGDRKNDRSDAVQEEEKNPLLEDGQVLNEEEIAEIPEITYEEFKKLISKIVRLNDAVPYVVAAGYRKYVFDILLTETEKYIIDGSKSYVKWNSRN